MYNVKRLLIGESCSEAEIFELTHFYLPADNPITRGYVVLREGLGFEFVMWCYEENPRAIYHNPNDPVHTDSCMEVYVNFYPEIPEHGYLTVEMNANAASHCSIGTGRHTRGFVVDRGLPHPEVKAEKLKMEHKPVWRVSTLVRLSLLESLYGSCEFPNGHKMKANFYKYAEHAAPPHAEAWNPISRLDFHCPECFGDLVIG